MIITQLIFLLFIIFFIRYKKKAVLYIIPLSLFFTMLPVVRIGGTYIGLCDAINFVIYGYILGRKDARKAIFCNPLFLLYLANLHTSFLCNLIYPTFSRILLYSC